MPDSGRREPSTRLGFAATSLRTLVSPGEGAHNARMAEADGTGDEVDLVVDRLAARFPTLERDHVARIVQEEHDRLGEARVRDFIPVLVEHAATERLRLEAHPLFTPIEGDAGNFVLDDPVNLDPIEMQRRAQPSAGPFLGNSGGG